MLDLFPKLRTLRIIPTCVFNPILPYPTLYILPYHTLSYSILPYPTLSYPILPYSYPTYTLYILSSYISYVPCPTIIVFTPILYPTLWCIGLPLSDIL